MAAFITPWLRDSKAWHGLSFHQSASIIMYIQLFKYIKLDFIIVTDGLVDYD